MINDAGFIENEDGWPNWPILPVKRRGNSGRGPEPGIP